jgi:CBS domain-containing protein
MKVQKILDIKGTDVFSVRPDASMRSFSEMVVKMGIGAAPVTDADGALLGIVSERDIVRGFHTHGANLENITVDAVMTKDVIKCGPDNTIADVIDLMTSNKIRHVPVLEDDQLVGFISIRDVAFNKIFQLELDNETLRIMLENYETMG